MKKVALAVMASLIAAQSVADHWVELDASYSFGDYSYSEEWLNVEAEYSTPRFSAQVYIPSVSTESGPYEEAGFLQQASAVYFSNEVVGANYSYKTISGGAYEYSSHSRNTTIGGYGVINRWLIGGEVSTIFGQGEHFADMYKVVGGYYVAEAALLSAGLASLQIDCDYCDEQNESDTALELKYHQVFRASESMSYALSVDWLKADDFHSYGVEGAMYFTPKMGLSLRAEKNTGVEYSDTDLTIKYQQFINDRVGLSAAYTDSEYYGAGDNAVGLVSFGVQVNI